jgi:ABC-2 type transport system ATP-binding protein
LPYAKKNGCAWLAMPKRTALHLRAPISFAGITLAQLAPQLPNLEETFFEMTGDK